MAIDITNATIGGSSNMLPPFTVQQVLLTSIKHENGKDKNDNPYHCIKVEFENKDGVFTETLFCPIKSEDPEGFVRKTLGNSKYPNPSKEEQFIYGLLDIIHVMEEKDVTRFKKYYAKYDPTTSVQVFEKFCTGVEQLVNETIVTPKLELQIKLSGDSQGRYPRRGGTIALNKEGNVYVSTFIARASDKPLTFSVNEAKYIEKVKAGGYAGKPTKISDDLDDAGIEPANDIDRGITDEELDAI